MSGVSSSVSERSPAEFGNSSLTFAEALLKGEIEFDEPEKEVNPVVDVENEADNTVPEFKEINILLHNRSSLEQRFVKTLFYEQDLIADYAKRLTAAHFSDKLAQNVWIALVNKRAVKPSIFDKVKEPGFSEAELTNVAYELERLFYNLKIEDYGAQLIQAAQEQDTLKVLDLIQKPPMLQLTSKKDDLMSLQVQRYMDLSTGNASSVSVQTPELKPLNLTFSQGFIITIGAPPSGGKSALTEQIALDLSAQGAMVVDYSIELGDNLRIPRYWQHYYGPTVGPQAIRSGLYDPDLLKKAINDMGYIQNPITGNKELRPLHVVSEPGNLRELLSDLSRKIVEHETYAQARLAEGFGVGPLIVIVDFIQHLNVDGMEEVNAQAEVMTQLHAVSKKHNVSFIWVAQLGKNVPGEMKANPDYIPSMSNFEGRNKLNQLTWDAVILELPEYHLGGAGKKYQKARYTRVKAREGGQLEFEGLYEGSRMNFTFDPHQIRIFK